MSPAYKELADTQHLLQKAEERLEELEVDLENAESYIEELEGRCILREDPVLEGMLADLEQNFLDYESKLGWSDLAAILCRSQTLVEYLRSKGVVRQ